MIRTLVAVLAALVLAGCADDGTAGAPTGTPPSSTPPHTAAEIQLRRVIASVSPGAAHPGRAELAAFTCPEEGAAAVVAAERDLACDAHGTKFLLEPAAYAGFAASATAEMPAQRAIWAVNVKLDAEGARVFTKLSAELTTSGDRLALVIDGVVLAAPQFEGTITTGDFQIVGGFTERSARALAERLS